MLLLKDMGACVSVQSRDLEKKNEVSENKGLLSLGSEFWRLRNLRESLGTQEWNRILHIQNRKGASSRNMGEGRRFNVTTKLLHKRLTRLSNF